MKNLLVSFSGGETSAFMAQWLKNHYDEFGYENIVFVFANTGLENEQTLKFVNQCESLFGIEVVWIEALIDMGDGVGTSYIIKDYNTATRLNDWKTRDDTPFEMLIKKYGIPNHSFPHCTRELKAVPIRKYASDYFSGEKYHTAIGIRIDEIDRMNEKANEIGIIYPLIRKDMIPSTKPKINFFWKAMPYRLELKGYQGNCATCWKKSDHKLYRIAQENVELFDFMAAMEKKYPRTGHEFTKDESARDRVFFRKHRSASDIIRESKAWSGVVIDDSQNYNWQIDLFEGESCEVFSECIS